MLTGRLVPRLRVALIAGPLLIYLYFYFSKTPTNRPAGHAGAAPKPLHAIHIADEKPLDHANPLWTAPSKPQKGSEGPFFIPDDPRVQDLKAAASLESQVAEQASTEAGHDHVMTGDLLKVLEVENGKASSQPEDGLIAGGAKVPLELPSAAKSPFEPVDVGKSPFDPAFVAAEAPKDVVGNPVDPASVAAAAPKDVVKSPFDPASVAATAPKDVVGAIGGQQAPAKDDTAKPGQLLDSIAPDAKIDPAPVSNIVASLGLNTSSLATSDGSLWNSIEYIFGFGDSWTTTSFDVFGPQPSRSNPFGNPDLPKNGTTTPPEWLYYLTTTYNHTSIRTYNMAKGGAIIDRTVVPPHPVLAFTQGFTEQVPDVFGRVYGSRPATAPWEAKNTLFAVWFGTVDMALLLDREEYTANINAKLIASYAATMGELYKTGARKFLLLNVPPMHLMPGAQHTEVSKVAVPDFNAKLLALHKEFLGMHTDAEAFLFDVNGLLASIIKDPSVTPQTSNIRNTTDNCWDYNPDAFAATIAWDRFDARCNIPFDQYFWANPLHPTHPVHDAIAARVVSDCMGAKRVGFCT